jgi:excinuclease ABC subunit A
MHPLRLQGARTHNLKDVSLELAPGSVTALTGVSGAGKSSLALHTLYAEGQRRFVESFSPYARQFLERLERPPMDSLEPVPAAVAVDRAAPVKSSRSTVATMADLAPLISALFQRESIPLCPEHGLAGVRRGANKWSQALVSQSPQTRAVVTYSVPARTSEEYLLVRDGLATQGYSRLWLDNTVRTIDSVPPSEVANANAVDVVVDRVTLKSSELPRIAEALEQAFARGAGLARVHLPDAAVPAVECRDGLACPTCARPLMAPSKGLFSSDSPLGACKACKGFGRVIGIDLDRVIPDPYKTLKQRAIRPWNGKSTEWERGELRKLCERHGIPLDVPFKELTEPHKHLIWHGDGSWHKGLFPGILGWFAWLETRTYKMHVRVLLSKYRSYDLCPECNGTRFNGMALGYRVAQKSIAEWNALEIGDALRLLTTLEAQTLQGQLIIDQVRTRLSYLERVGLGYLNLDRQARTLSGGENQRVTLTAALGTSLHNALFVLDEPSVGLHATDVSKLALVIEELAQRNNIVLLVEHDPTLIAAASRVVELGPKAGAQGGSIVFDGSIAHLLHSPRPELATYRALVAASVSESGERRTPENWLSVKGASEHNLKRVDAQFPLGAVTTVSGPSGSGKSTLCVDVLYRALARRFSEKDVERPGEHEAIAGDDALRGVTLIDQSPLGRTSRGNAATYTKAWDHLRKLFAAEPAAQQHGFTASHFSFNVDGGRCEACAGEGFETVEMQFLADVQLLCPVCQGQRFKPEVVSVVCRGRSVAEVLNATVDDVLAWFSDATPILRSLGPVKQLGMGYLRLGQPLSTLSGGEAQRLKLARALNEKLDKQLFVVDEPSASLHADEVSLVLNCFDWIVAGGGTVIAVEHDLAVIAASDWVIELGPGGGKHGGDLVFAGHPTDLVRASTATGEALRRLAAPTPFQTSARKTSIHPAKPFLVVKNAREHTLKQINVSIPHQELSVVTGPSGSGKSSLVFDVIFAEGQRRFLETLTPYARQFLPTMPKPDVDEVSGVPPSIALEQRTSRAGANSTVATVTEVAHYLRLLFAKLGTPHCPEHGLPISATSKHELLRQLRNLKGRGRLLAPVVQARKGTYLDVFDGADRDGISEAYCDGELVATQRPPKLSRTKEHTIDLVMTGEVRCKEIDEAALERALSWGKGRVKVRFATGETELFGTADACSVCGFSVPELDPRWFSFNTKQGACPHCEGSGRVEQGLIKVPKGKKGKRSKKVKTAEPPVLVTCPSCDGTRLSKVPRAVKLAGQSYAGYSQRSVADFEREVLELNFSGNQRLIAEPILKELTRRVKFLLDVGLGYLALDRAASTLSGGELQRLRLAAQLGSGLTGALYVLDEPTIGLHPRDTGRLLDNLRRLVDIGSTVVVVEHDADVIRAADYLVDMGPEGGRGGGKVVAAGRPADVLQTQSPTALELTRRSPVRSGTLPAKGGNWLVLSGVSANNLKNVRLEIPEKRFTVVAGVSGSGKSTLIRSVLLPAVRQALGLVTTSPGAFVSLSGERVFKRALSVDQSPIGRTPRSVPATFLGIWDSMRQLFAKTPDAQVAGFSAARFSFNSPSGGRCNTCDGQGSVTHEMSFLPDVVQDCPECAGSRFDEPTLRVRYRGYNIGEVLHLTVAEACEVFQSHPKVVAPLRTLVELGAGYLKLGQGSHTLSGGEAQRLKLAAELTATTRHEATLYVLDEPTTGLHQSDVVRLVAVLERLVERGDTLVVIEHHPWVIAGADHVIELGPEGGEHGGTIVFAGSPKQLRRKNTATASVVSALV